MADYPLLVLPASEDRGKRSPGSGRPPKLQLPGKGRQRTRLEDKLAALQKQLQDRAVQLQVSAMGAEPEAVIVLEIVGAADDFAKAVQRVEGLEWLGELVEQNFESDDDFYALNSKGERTDKRLSGRLFMVFSNKRAMGEILKLWADWRDEKKLPHHYGKWREVFDRLRDVRLWGVKDRVLETGVLEAWRQDLEFGGEVRCEIEVWHRQAPDRLRSALERVERFVTELKGTVHGRCSIDEIHYHALVVKLPRASIERVLEDPSIAGEIKLLLSEDVQFVRPVGQFAAHVGELEVQDAEIPEATISEAEPVSALLDGLPLQNHGALSKHLVVDDCDGFEEDYVAAKRRHGTAMASVIVNGDLSSPQPIKRTNCYRLWPVSSTCGSSILQQRA
ncbi:MAG: hypothetical protein GY811_20815 [Myxococcales bacterium]|nr:hypothetical protein [Myxococcales bacterium]